MNNTAVYDSDSDRLTIFGGFNTPSCCNSVANDVWILTNANRKAGTRQWVNVLPNAPSDNAPQPTAAASAVYDRNRNMIVYGGQVGGKSSSDVWILRNANGVSGTPFWVHPTVSGTPPPPRQNHQAVYDPTSDQMIVLGGLQFTGIFPVALLNDVWVLKNASTSTPQWEQLGVLDTAIPSGRHSFVAFYDISKDRLSIYGGCTDVAFNCLSGSAELWALTNSRRLNGAIPIWQLVASYGRRPTAYAQYASAAYDDTSNQLFVFGGRTGTSTDPNQPFGTFTNETWVLNYASGPGMPVWTQLQPGGTPPAPRGQSVAPDLYDPKTSRLIVFGGPELNDTRTLFTH